MKTHRIEDLVKEIETLTKELLDIEPDVMTSLEKYILRKFLVILDRETEMPKFTGSALIDRSINEMEWIAHRHKQRTEQEKKPKKKKKHPLIKSIDAPFRGVGQ